MLEQKTLIHVSSTDRNILRHYSPYDFKFNLSDIIYRSRNINIVSLKCGMKKFGTTEKSINTSNFISLNINDIANNFKSGNPCIQKSFGLIECGKNNKVCENIYPRSLSLHNQENLQYLHFTVKHHKENTILSSTIEFAEYIAPENGTNYNEYINDSSNIYGNFPKDKKAFYFICLKIYDKIWDNAAFSNYTETAYKTQTIKQYLDVKREHFGFHLTILEHILKNCNYASYLEKYYAEDILWVLAYGNYKKEEYMQRIESKNKNLVETRKSSNQNADIDMYEPDTRVVERFFNYNTIYQEPLKSYIKDDRLGETCMLDDDSQFEIILEVNHE